MEAEKNFKNKNKFYLENIKSTTELELIQKLIETNKININESSSLTYLLSLIIKPKKTSKNNINLLLYLLKFFSKKNENIFKEFTFQACKLSKDKILKTILDKNFDINSQNEIGETLLHVSIAKSDIKIIKLLLEYSPDQNIKTFKDKLSVIDYAFEQDNTSIITLLKKGNQEKKKFSITFIDNNDIITTFPSKKNDIIDDDQSINISYLKKNSINQKQNELLNIETQSDEEDFSKEIDSIEIKLTNQVKLKEDELKNASSEEKDEILDEENDSIFNELTGNIQQRISNFSSFEDNFSIFHQKFSMGIKEKEKNIMTYRKSAKLNFLDNSSCNKIINTDTNTHNKFPSKLTRELSTNLPSLVIPLKNENENDFFTEQQSLLYNNAYNSEQREKKNNENFINFFKEIGVNIEYIKLLSLNGFDDLNLLIEQSKNGIAMSDENLREIGIKFPGIRAKISIHLEELANLFDFPIEREKVYFQNERNKNCLYRFLSSINLECYLNNFIDNGYTSPELLFVQMQSKQPINDNILCNEIKIDKIGYRMRIINKIKNEGFNYLYKLKNGFLNKNNMFSDSNNVVFERKNNELNNNNEFCNMCAII